MFKRLAINMVYRFVLILLFTISMRLSDSVTVTCIFETADFIDIGNQYFCTGTMSDLKDDIVTAISGTHLHGKNHSSVTGFRIASQKITQVPRKLETFFPNLRVVAFYANAITEVTNDHLKVHKHLEGAYFMLNKITNLDSNLFDGLPNLKMVHFNSNNIKHIGHDIQLPSTGAIYFQSNPCIKEYAKTPEAIAALKFQLTVNCPPTITQIEQSLDGRNNSLTRVKSNVVVLTSNMRSLEKVVDHINNDVQGVKNNVDVIDTDTTTLKTNVQIIGNDMQILDSNVTNLSRDVHNLNGDVQVINGEIQHLHSNVNLLRVGIQVLKTNLESLNCDMQIVKGNVENFGNSKQSLNSNVQMLEERQNAMNEQINNLKENDLIWEKRIKHLKWTINRLRDTLSELVELLKVKNKV